MDPRVFVVYDNWCD